MVKTEVLPVSPELVPTVWKAVRRVVLAKIPGYDVERTHLRLLAGIDQLWVAFGWRNAIPMCLTGCIITSISDRPPKRKVFRRADPALMKSLTIHVAGEIGLLSWLDSAIERIGLYARQHGCRMLFLLARKSWARYIKRFYSPEWELVAISRDRPTRSTCKAYRTRNTPGYFRPLVPVPRAEFSRHRYRIVGSFYFPMDMEAA